jgi:hypothetical protein
VHSSERAPTLAPWIMVEATHTHTRGCTFRTSTPSPHSGSVSENFSTYSHYSLNRKKWLVIWYCMNRVSSCNITYVVQQDTQLLLWLNIYSQYVWQLDMFRTYRSFLRSVYKLCVAGLVCEENINRYVWVDYKCKCMNELCYEVMWCVCVCVCMCDCVVS